MPVIDKKLEYGDLRFFYCSKCHETGIPVDTRIIKKYQFTKCMVCGGVVKYRYNGEKKQQEWIWSADYQKSPKLKGKILTIELDKDNVPIKILTPKEEIVNERT